MNTEQERADFEAWWEREMAPRITGEATFLPKLCWEAYQAGRAALQSQPVIDEDHLSIVLDVYDNAMQKAFDGREFKNPCKPGTPEHKAWEKGSKEGKKKRDAGLPHSIALQSQDREDAERYRAFRAANVSKNNSFYRAARVYGKDNFVDPENPTEAEFDASIDHARRVEEKK